MEDDSDDVVVTVDEDDHDSQSRAAVLPPKPKPMPRKRPGAASAASSHTSEPKLPSVTAREVPPLVTEIEAAEIAASCQVPFSCSATGRSPSGLR